jgi:hypothetical protein
MNRSPATIFTHTEDLLVGAFWLPKKRVEAPGDFDCDALRARGSRKAGRGSWLRRFVLATGE